MRREPLDISALQSRLHNTEFMANTWTETKTEKLSWNVALITGNKCSSKYSTRVTTVTTLSVVHHQSFEHIQFHVVVAYASITVCKFS